MTNKYIDNKNCAVFLGECCNKDETGCGNCMKSSQTTSNKLTDNELEVVMCMTSNSIDTADSEFKAAYFRSVITLLCELQERRKADSEPVGAPVAWMWEKKTGYITAGINRPMYETLYSAAIPLYAAPQPLTDAERAELQERRKADGAEPIYQLFDSGWYDTNKSTFDTVTGTGMKGRIVYTAPQPAPDSEAQDTLKRLAVILHGSEVDLNLLTVTAQSLMDRCKQRSS